MKTILITGAATGIGLSLANKLSSESLILTYHSHKPDNLKNYYPLDLTEDQSINNLADSIKTKYKSIDILINNAAVCLDKPFAATNFDEINLQINTNLTGTLKLTSLLLPLIKAKIINIASECAKEIYPEYAVYTATKFALRSFTQVLAKENHNLNFVTVNPGPTSTQMNGFQGVSPDVVAQRIIDKAINNNMPSGSDLDLYKELNAKW